MSKKATLGRMPTRFPYLLTRTPDTFEQMLTGVVDVVTVYERELVVGHPVNLLATALECDTEAVHALQFARITAANGPMLTGGKQTVDSARLDKQAVRLGRMVDRARNARSRSVAEVESHAFKPAWHLRDALKLVDWFHMEASQAQQYVVLLERFRSDLRDALPDHWVTLWDNYRRQHDLVGAVG